MSGDRPFWSVMIPVYRPRLDLLTETLRCVLAQAPAPDEMEIVVVDDASGDSRIERTIAEIGGGRIAYHQEPVNRGLAATWNRCIERAGGRWIHILHQDDLVMPGFYAALRRGCESSNAGAAYCRHAWIDSNGHWIALSALESALPGILPDFARALAVAVKIQTPSVVVRRDVYEEVGGFLPTLCYTLDWEMWQRIAWRFPFWYEPQILACYRLHPGSESARLATADRQRSDVLRCIELCTNHAPPAEAASLARLARRSHALGLLSQVMDPVLTGNFAAARALILGAVKTSMHRSVLGRAFSQGIWATREQLRCLAKGPRHPVPAPDAANR